jgi:hypothetical protein
MSSTTSGNETVTDAGHHVPQYETTTVCIFDPTKKGKSAYKCKTTVRKLPESDEAAMKENIEDHESSPDDSSSDSAENDQPCSVKLHKQAEEARIKELMDCMQDSMQVSTQE